MFVLQTSIVFVLYSTSLPGASEMSMEYKEILFYSILHYHLQLARSARFVKRFRFRVSPYFKSAVASEIAESISGKIKGNNSLNINSTTYSPFKLSQILNLQCDNIGFQNTSTGEIEKIIYLLPWKNSCGYDEVSIELLKISAPFISSPL
jgi:hypothetical protein